jgi:hypothetical protein
MVAGGPDRVSVASNPAGATVFVDSKPVGRTPITVELDRAHSQGEFRLELAGFRPALIRRNKEINGWVWGNILIGGIIGIIIDVASGNASRFDDTPITVGLTPTSSPDGLPGLPAPPPATATPTVSSTPCAAERHRVLVEAKQIHDPYERVRVINSAPHCN